MMNLTCSTLEYLMIKDCISILSIAFKGRNEKMLPAGSGKKQSI